MRFVFAFVSAIALMASSLSAQENDKPSVPRTVKLEAVIAEFTAAEGARVPADDKEIIAHVRDLEQKGKLDSLTRMKMTTVDGQPGMVQFGERVPMVTGRAGGRGFPGGNAVSYTMENVGTMIQITPAIRGGEIVLECMVEQSKQAPHRQQDGEDAAAGIPPQTNVLTSKATLSLGSGQTGLLASRQKTEGGGTTHIFILVTATADEAKF